MKRRGGGSIYQRGGALWIKYYRDGQPIRESVATTLGKRPADVTEKDAQALLNKRVGAIAGGQPIVLRADRVRLPELLDDLLTEYTVNKRRSIKRARLSVAHLREFFGDARAQAVDTARVRTYIETRQAQGARNATVNRELAALKRAYSLASQARKILSRPYIPMLVEDNVRKGFFEPEQFAAVRPHLPEYLRPLSTFAYVTGWRVKSELLTREASHVDERAGWLRLEPGETKNGEGRMFPLLPNLRAALEEQRVYTDKIQRAKGCIVRLLFHRKGKPIRGFRKAWLTACLKAGFAQLVSEKPRIIKAARIPHDFRRTAVRNLERAGVPRSAAMKMVGHRTESIYRRYAIADEAMLREAGEKLSALHETERAPSRTVVPLAAVATQAGDRAVNPRLS